MKSLAGTVMAPSSSTFAGTQQLIPTSRLVAVRRRRPESVRSRTFPRIGRLPRVETLAPRSRAHAPSSLVNKRPSRGPPRSYPVKIHTTSSGSSSGVDYGASLVVRAQRKSGRAVEGPGTLVDGQKAAVTRSDTGTTTEHPGAGHVHKQAFLSTRRDLLSTPAALSGRACRRLGSDRGGVSRRIGAREGSPRPAGNRRSRPSPARSSRSRAARSSGRGRRAPHRCA